MKNFSLWLVLSGATITAGIVVPYGVLSGGTTPIVFVFWCAFGLAVIALIAAGGGVRAKRLERGRAAT